MSGAYWICVHAITSIKTYYLTITQSHVQKKKFVRACLTDEIEECGDNKDDIEDFFDDRVTPLEKAVITLGLRRRPQLMNMKRIRYLSLPRIRLSMKQIQKALHQKGGLHHGRPLKSLTSQRAVLSYLRHVVMCVPSSFDDDMDYLSVLRPSKALHMNSQASLFLQSIQGYCERTNMRSTNSGVPKFPDCLTDDGGKVGRVLVVGIVRGMLGRGLSKDPKDNIVSYVKDCHEIDRTAIDIVWQLYPRYQKWLTNFVIPVQYMSGLGCVPFIKDAEINKRSDKVNEWLSNYEESFVEDGAPRIDTSENRVEYQESDHPDEAPATPCATPATRVVNNDTSATKAVNNDTPEPSKRRRISQDFEE